MEIQYHFEDGSFRGKAKCLLKEDSSDSSLSQGRYMVGIVTKLWTHLFLSHDWS